MPEDVQAPRTEHELTKHLAATLVQTEVVGPMMKQGWEHGEPPAPGAADNPPTQGAPSAPATGEGGTTPAPAGAPGDKASTPATPIDWESLKDPKTGLILGKYQNEQEATRGVGHAVNMAKEALAREARAKQELADATARLSTLSQTQPAVSPAAAPQVQPFTPASRAEFDKANHKLEAVLSSVVENGGVLDEDAVKELKNSLREIVDSGARIAAEEFVVTREASRNAEDKKWAEVDEFMEGKYPGSQRFADEVGLFVGSNPLIQIAVQALSQTGKEKEAAELAWVEFDKARTTGTAAASLAAAATKEIQLEAADQVRREAVDQARKDAGVGTSSAGGVHEAPVTDPSRDEINAAADAMRAYGTTPGNPAAERWRHLVITRHLPAGLFEPR